MHRILKFFKFLFSKKRIVKSIKYNKIKRNKEYLNIVLQSEDYKILDIKKKVVIKRYPSQTLDLLLKDFKREDALVLKCIKGSHNSKVYMRAFLKDLKQEKRFYSLTIVK